jgi:hypothetical protein
VPIKYPDNCEKKLFSNGLILWFVLITSVTASQIVGAQELEPRTYANIPVNMNFLALGYVHSKGNILLDPSLPIEDLNAKTDYAFLRYTRSLGLLSKTAKLKVMLPYAWGQYEGRVEGIPVDRNISGIGDAVLGLDISFMGAPAMSGDAFSQYRQKTIVGASVRVAAPTGKYDNTKIINLGSNRWAFKGELGASRQLGNWTLELAGALWAFTDNTDFLEGLTLSQAPFYTVKAHAIYTFKPGLWLGVGAGYGEGGQTTVEGSKRDTYQRNLRLGGVLSYPIAENHGLNFVLVTGFRDGRGSDFDSLGVAYQYAWGGD